MLTKMSIERQLNVTPPSSSSGLSRFWANTNVELLYRASKAHKDEIEAHPYTIRKYKK